MKKNENENDRKKNIYKNVFKLAQSEVILCLYIKYKWIKMKKMCFLSSASTCNATEEMRKSIEC